MRFFIEGYRRLITHPRYGIWVILGTLLYLLSPIDISPDILPIVGQVDDVALLVLFVSAASQWFSQQFLTGKTSHTVDASSVGEKAVQQTIDIDAVEVKSTE